MPLADGTTLGPYEVRSPLGRGGMGEVYRARDAKLGRDVAVKVLPGELALDDERLKRFQREAKVLASLNHPNIAAIYGLEEHEGTHYLVLELVEGETLAERLARGALPIDEAIEVASKIADALESAHERGIVHRDLKPANVKLTPEDDVKVLDFGLAKALVEDGPEADSSLSPTITRDATRAGVILGTAAYMSPEQAKGKRVDKRSDIFAFGAVLYEMLAGAKAFSGEDVSETLAAVIKSEPDWSALPEATPTRVRELLRRCLEKDRAQRLRDVGDARLELRESPKAVEPPRARAASMGGYVVTALLAAALALGASWWLGRTSFDRAPPSRLTIQPPPDTKLRGNVTLSPDGRTLLFLTVEPDALYRRSLGDWATTLLREGASFSTSVSPDSQWVAFSDGNGLFKMPMEGGEPIQLSQRAASQGSDWGDHGQIVFGQLNQLWIVSENGGTAEAITELEDGAAQDGRWLPGGRAVLFRGPDGIEVLELASRTRTWLLEGHTPRYTRSGHLVFARGATLWAVPFDPVTLELTGDPVPMAEDVRRSPFNGTAYIGLSANGNLAYQPSRGSPTGSLVWVDAEGRTTPAFEGRAPYRHPRLSRDGTQLLVTIAPGFTESDVWLLDLARGVRTRLTRGATNGYPVWSRDGERVLFSSAGGDASGLFTVPVDGTGSPEMLFETASALHWADWFEDGRFVAFGPTTGTAGSLSLRDEDGEVTTIESAAAPRLSPDGRYLAYVGGESGENQIYVRDGAGRGEQFTVSTRGGARAPIWSRDGRTLYYRYANGELWAVDVTYEPRFSLSKPRLVLRIEAGVIGGPLGRYPLYDAAPDGRFLMVQDERVAAHEEIRVILNWSSELERVAPSR